MSKEIGPAPHAKEALPKYEKLLSEATTGAQALLLLGIEPPKADAPVVVVRKEELLKSATQGIPADHKKRLTDASFNERDEYWKDTPVAERKEIWKKSGNACLDTYTKDQNKRTEQAFLKAILKRDNPDEINADTLYDTFMLGEGKGDIEFFARRIVDTHIDKLEEIENKQELIKKLGVIYGYNSAKITERLAYAIANARSNPDKFTFSAQENLNKRAYGENVWKGVADNDAQWARKEKERVQTGGQSVPEPPQPQQEETP